MSAAFGPRVVLVGPPGVGKTTVGRVLAQRWAVEFTDTDDVVEVGAGQPVRDIFVTAGEPEFRRLEAIAVAESLRRSGVVALGGGAVLDPQTRAALGTHRVVFLDVGLADAARRVGLNRDRPLLLRDVRGQWLDLMAARRPLYLEVADATVSTDGLNPDEVADAVETAVTSMAS
jgi:shikimate kinase